MNTKWVMLGFAAAGLITACGDDSEDTSQPTQDVEINFQALVGEAPFACGQDYSGIGSTGETLTPSDLRLYVSNVRLLNARGEEVPVELAQDGIWQYQNVALLDFEDGTGPCENGTSQTNSAVIGKVPVGEYSGIVFDLGVPADINHLDSAVMPSPLNLTAMWWNWQGGYKFLRVEGKTTGLDGWRLHLGSTACVGEPGEPINCMNANRAQVRFESGFSTQSKISLNLQTLLAESDLSKDDGGAVGCMSAPDDMECGPMFKALGIGNQSQNFFSLK